MNQDMTSESFDVWSGSFFVRALLIGGFIAISSEALACFPVGTYTIVDYPSGFLVPRESFTPNAPRISLLRIVRGDRSHPCSRFGTLVFSLDEGIHPDIAGYRFRVLSGGLPEDIFPNAIVRPGSHGGRDSTLSFVWTETSIMMKPLDARVEVRAVARDGVEGEAVILKVRDAGGGTGMFGGASET